MAQANQQELFSFANNFWGEGDAGVSALLTHVNNVKHTGDELRNFYHERAIIEDEYSSKLVALSRQTFGTHEIGTFKQSFETIRHATEAMGKSHAMAAAQIRTELDDSLAVFSSNLNSRRKTIQTFVEKLTTTKKTHTLSVESARERFETECNKIKSYYLQQNVKTGKDLARTNHKIEKAHTNIESSKREYQNALLLLAEATDIWAKEWKIACDKLQDLEEERVNFLKSNLWAYTNVVSTVCVKDDESCENIRLALENTDVLGDNELFVQTNATGSEIIDPPAFVNYLGGQNIQDNSKTFKTAQFSRLSQIGIDDLGSYPTASVRASRDRRSNDPSVLAQLQEQRASPYQQQPDKHSPYSANNKSNAIIYENPGLGEPQNPYEPKSISPAQRHNHQQTSSSLDPTVVSNQDFDHHGYAGMKNSYLRNSTNNNSNSHNDKPSTSSRRIILTDNNTRSSPIYNEDYSTGPSPYSSSHATSASNLASTTSTAQTSHPSPDRKSAPQSRSQPIIKNSSSGGVSGNSNNNDMVNLNSNARPNSAAANNDLDDSPKKRSWASPFSRKSNKNTDKAYHTGTASDSEGPHIHTQVSPTAIPGNGPKYISSQPFGSNPRAPPEPSSRPGSTVSKTPISSVPMSRKFPHHNNNDNDRSATNNRINDTTSKPNSRTRYRNDPALTSTNLSTDDKFFDLGVNSSQPPYNGPRSKSASPTKSYGHNEDPLVNALENLKVTSGSNAVAESIANHPGRNQISNIQQQQPYTSSSGGGSMGSNMNPKTVFNNSMHSGGHHNHTQYRSSQNQQYGINYPSTGGGYEGYDQGNNPVLRHKNSGSALVPSDPAFTYNDMQTTSDGYSNQTREIFTPRDQHLRGRGNSGEVHTRRTLSPVPHSHQAQRPRTMYDGEFQNMDQYGRVIGHGGTDGYDRPRHGDLIKHQRSHSAAPINHGPHYGGNGYDIPMHSTGRSPSPNPINYRSLYDDGRYGPATNRGGRTPSPNPMSQRPAYEGNTYNSSISRSGRTPSPNPVTNNHNITPRSRSHSPNPMTMKNGRSRSPNPNMMRDRSRTPDPSPELVTTYGNVPSSSDYERYPRPGSAFGPPGGGNKNRTMTPNPGMMPGNSNANSPMANDNMNAGRSRNRNDFYKENSNQGSYNGSSSSMTMVTNNNQPLRNKNSVISRRSNGSFVSNASGNAMFNGRINRGNNMDHRADPRMGGQGSRPASRNTNASLRSRPNNDLPNLTRDGRQIIHYAQANFDYRAAIPEEVSFRQGDILLIVKMLEDGWWEAEVFGEGSIGLVPSNFLSDF